MQAYSKTLLHFLDFFFLHSEVVQSYGSFKPSILPTRKVQSFAQPIILFNNSDSVRVGTRVIILRNNIEGLGQA